MLEVALMKSTMNDKVCRLISLGNFHVKTNSAVLNHHLFYKLQKKKVKAHEYKVILQW